MGKASDVMNFISESQENCQYCEFFRSDSNLCAHSNQEWAGDVDNPWHPKCQGAGFQHIGGQIPEA